MRKVRTKYLIKLDRLSTRTKLQQRRVIDVFYSRCCSLICTFLAFPLAMFPNFSNIWEHPIITDHLLLPSLQD